MALYKYTTKSGQFYGVRFRVVEADGVERHKNLRGFTTQRAARQAQYEYERENSAHKKSAPPPKFFQKFFNFFCNNYVRQIYTDARFQIVYLCNFLYNYTLACSAQSL